MEEAILSALKEWIDDYKVELKGTIKKSNSSLKLIANQVNKYDTEILDLEKQLSKVYDLLEQGIYSTEEFLDRSKLLSDRINDAKHQKIELDKKHEIEKNNENNRVSLLPKVEYLLDVYYTLPTATDKNNLLKEVVEKVVYFKEKSASHNKGVDPKDFDVDVYPVIPPANDR